MEITANAVQTLEVGSNVIFTDTPVSGNCSIMHRAGSGLVKLRGLTNTQCRARFRVFFSRNTAIPEGGTAGPIDIAISIDGEPVESTRMIVTPTAEEAFFNIASGVYLDVPAGCCYTIGVKNVSTVPVDIQNANLIIERVA